MAKTKLKPWAALTQAQVNARVKRLSADPNRRAGIPDKYLPTKLMAARRAAQAKKAQGLTVNALSQVGKPLDAAAMLNVAQTLATTQTEPAAREYDRAAETALREGGAVQNRAQGYFRQLLGGSQAGADRIQETAKSGPVALAQATADAIRNLQAPVPAGPGGGITDLAASSARDAVAAQTARAIADGQSIGARAQELGASRAQLAQTLPSVVASRGQDIQGTLLANTTKAVTDARQKAADERAQLGARIVGQLVSQRKDEFTNWATAKELGLKAASANAVSADDKLAQAKVDFLQKYGYMPGTGPEAPAKPKTAAERLSEQKLVALEGMTPAQRQRALYPSTKPKAGSGKSNKDQATAFRSTIDNYVEQIKRGGLGENEAVKAAIRAGDTARVMTAVKIIAKTQGDNLKATQVRAIADFLTHGFVSPRVVAGMYGQGYGVPKGWVHPDRRKRPRDKWGNP